MPVFFWRIILKIIRSFNALTAWWEANDMSMVCGATILFMAMGFIPGVFMSHQFSKLTPLAICTLLGPVILWSTILISANWDTLEKRADEIITAAERGPAPTAGAVSHAEKSGGEVSDA